MVRVLAVADEEVLTATSRARRTECDLLVAAGDLPWDYLEHLADLLGVPAVHVPGNHDPEDRGPAPRGFTSVDDRVVEVAGLRIAGLGGSVRYNDGPHQFTQDELAQRVGALVSLAGGRPVDLVVTHAPPLGLGDAPDPCHVGIAALHHLVAELDPTWLLHGHVHPHGFARPDRTLGRTTLRNVIPWSELEVEPVAAVRSW